MKNIVLVSASPTRNGNGDALLEASKRMFESQDIKVHTFYIRDLNLHPCKACYGCAKTGVCVQNDDMKQILDALHECDGLIVESPIYYNHLSAQLHIVIDRLCCTFACKSYKVGPKKKIGVFLTCTGSNEKDMENHIDLLAELPSLKRSIQDIRTHVFTNCNTKDTCKNTEEYINIAQNIAMWMLDEGEM